VGKGARAVILLAGLALALPALGQSGTVPEPVLTGKPQYEAAPQPAVVPAAEVEPPPPRARHLIAVTGNVGTNGVGLGAMYILNRHFSTRAQFNGFDFQHTVSYHQTSYDADFKFLSLGLLGDWYPLGGIPIWGKLRISAGAYANFTHIQLNAGCTTNGSGCNVGDVFIGNPSSGTNGSPPGQLTADLKFNRFSPYAGIGIGQTLPGGRLHVGFDAGALFEGKPKFTLQAKGVAAVYDNGNGGAETDNVNLATDPNVQANLGYEQGGTQDRVSHFKIFPVISLTVGYWFKF